MPNVGFEIRDYSTRRRLVPGERALVLVPRRDSSMPPLEEAPHRNYRVSDRRNYFATGTNRQGDSVVTEVPVGAYEARVDFRGYVPRRLAVSSPSPFPVEVLLHRNVTYRFAPEDTRIYGRLDIQSGQPAASYSVRLLDPDPAVPAHEAPVSADGQFVLFVPEKTSAGPVVARVLHLGTVTTFSTTVPMVIARANVAPTITVT